MKFDRIVSSKKKKKNDKKNFLGFLFPVITIPFKFLNLNFGKKIWKKIFLFSDCRRNINAKFLG